MDANHPVTHHDDATPILRSSKWRSLARMREQQFADPVADYGKKSKLGFTIYPSP